MSAISYLPDLMASVTPLLLLLAGAFFAVRLRAFPFLHPVRACRLLFSPREKEPQSARSRHTGGEKEKSSTLPSPFRAACAAMAGTMGVGNITGVALALLNGGAGAIFWMWVCAAAGMLLKYAEIVLAMVYRQADGRGGWQGGTALTLRQTGHPGWGALFALLCLGYALLVGGVVQANAMATCLEDSCGTPPLLCGLLLFALTLPILLGGRERILGLTARLVPAMCVLYLGMAGAILLPRLSTIPALLRRIVAEAFALRPALAGGGGLLTSRALRVGAARGLMSNEGGCGTAPMAHATSAERIPARQGLWGVFEVFADTIVLCTVTALVILCICPDLPAGGGAAYLVRISFTRPLGEGAGGLFSLCLCLFAYATILCGALYGEGSLCYFTDRPAPRRHFAMLFSLSLTVGAVVLPQPVWQMTDLLLSCMTLCDLVLLLRHADCVVEKTRQAGLLPPFRPHG